MTPQPLIIFHFLLFDQLPLASVLSLAHVYINPAEILLYLMRSSFVIQAILHPLLGVSQALGHEGSYFLVLVERVALF